MYLGHLVELADSAELYRHPLHPYTEMLLSAIPIADPDLSAARKRIRTGRRGAKPLESSVRLSVQDQMPQSVSRPARESMPPLREVAAPGHFDSMPSHAINKENRKMQTSRYIIKRMLLAFVSLFAIITITYFLMNLMPGDPFMSEKASEENRAILIAKYGLDQPVYVQYGKYLTNLLHGDMGTSYVLQKGRAVKDIIFRILYSIHGTWSQGTDPGNVICGIILGCIAGLCKDKLAGCDDPGSSRRLAFPCRGM